jgi:hypothetical protein
MCDRLPGRIKVADYDLDQEGTFKHGPDAGKIPFRREEIFS